MLVSISLSQVPQMAYVSIPFISAVTLASEPIIVALSENIWENTLIKYSSRRKWSEGM